MNDYTTFYKICTSCKIEKPATTEFFGVEKRGSFGLRAVCKPCIKIQKRAYRQANKEKIAASKREYELQNRDAINHRQRVYRKANHAELLAKSRDYRQTNKEKIAIRKRAYRQLNKEKIAAYDTKRRKDRPEIIRLQNVKRRARKRALPYTFTREQWESCLEYFNYCCAVCGCQLRDLFGNIEPHADHWIPLSNPDCTGTVVTNMICLCNTCNLHKNAKHPEQWLIAKYGERKARIVLARVHEYFSRVSEIKNE